ncbi:ImmA/IrrE family metallo-endopeptidase [Jiangella alba]|uniref:Uncharacterized protein n=1 Tax=Jiangella alba TaxID=561176 RepID=A0A1H5PDH6_9ACTN|nr:ImmA/IrrE family metallo-endopeptidase [Jiangella alba]SEF11770.1 protein of unknown function [Jiangella alba]
MALSPGALRVELRRAGIANAAVDAVWPQWWSSEAESSLSATAELTFTIARRLGLSPQDLLEGEARFVWRDEAKFKLLAATVSAEEQALSSFGCAVARAAVAGVPATGSAASYNAGEIRDAILREAPFVHAEALLAFAWGVGIPVLQLRIFPLAQKRMHAMTAAVGGRSAVLLARDSSYLAPMTFTLAHEIGHVMLGHLTGATAVVDVEDPFVSPESDDAEEAAADRFALELLTGEPRPTVLTNIESFSATQLASAVSEQGPRLGIEPGFLAMCVGHSTKQWEKVYGSLKIIAPGYQDVPGWLNSIAERQLDWLAMTEDSQDYLRVVMGLPRDDV